MYLHQHILSIYNKFRVAGQANLKSGEKIKGSIFESGGKIIFKESEIFHSKRYKFTQLEDSNLFPTTSFSNLFLRKVEKWPHFSLSGGELRKL